MTPAGGGATARQTSDRIADSAITVIARDGLDALSIRRVAAEAGVAIGTVQHHYPTRAELVLAALQRTAHRQQVRAMAAHREPTIIATLITRLSLLLPHDEPSQEEAITWVALAAAAARDPLVGPHQRQVVKRTISAIAGLLDRAVQDGELPPGTDTADLAERVDAVVGGYLLHIASSARLATRRTKQQFRTSLAALSGTSAS
jgi:AcrR family transcriptional regulator